MFDSVEPKNALPVVAAPMPASPKPTEPISPAGLALPMKTENKPIVSPTKVKAMNNGVGIIERFINHYRLILVIVIIIVLLSVVGFVGWQYYSQIMPIKSSIVNQEELLAKSMEGLAGARESYYNQEEKAFVLVPTIRDKEGLIVILDAIAVENNLKFALLEDVENVDQNQLQFIISDASLDSLVSFEGAIETRLNGVVVSSVEYLIESGDYKFSLNIETK